jgi:Flp pilus assembly pilin Flp
VESVGEGGSEFGPSWRQFGNDERGQDLVEYTLLLAFVCLASAALFINGGQSISTIWTIANATASNAAVAAS